MSRHDSIATGPTAFPSALPSIPPSASQSLPVDQRVAGRYQVLDRLGGGGMGVVYRAHDLELDEVVALKVLRPDLADQPGMLERFRREVKLARRVTHPSVARVYELGEHHGVRFLTMEYVRGDALSTVLERDAPLPLARSVAFARGVCAALEAAHAVGVVHRDIKPDNVMLAEGDRVVVTDFGIAHSQLDEPSMLQTSAPTGTPAYMAPEQVLSQPSTARTDIYALGVMMFEMFTGRLPWRGESAYAVAAARLAAGPPDPRDAAPTLPDAAALIVLRAMAREPRDRFASAAAVADALADVPLAAARATARPAAPRTRAPTVDLPAHGTFARPLPSLAVLPFRAAPGADGADLADGLTEDVTDALSTVRGLRVLSRGAVARAKSGDAQEVGRALAVDITAEGTLRRVGAGIRVSTRLVDVHDGYQLGAWRFELAPDGAGGLGDEIAGAITASLFAGANAGASAGVPRAASGIDEAAALRCRATRALNGTSSASAGRAATLFQRAVDVAPDDARALAGLAMAQLRLASSDGARRPDTVRAARKLAAAAVRHDPRRPAARLALASALLAEGEPVAAARQLRAAVAIAPSCAEAHGALGRLLLESGHPREGVRRLDAAAELGAPAVRRKWAAARGATVEADWASAEPLVDAAFGVRGAAAARWLERVRRAAWESDADALRALARRWKNAAAGAVDAALVDAALGVFAKHRGAVEALALVSARAVSPPAEFAHRAVYYRALEVDLAGAAGEIDAACEALEAADAEGLLDARWLESTPFLAALREGREYKRVRRNVRERAHAVFDAVWAEPA